MSRTTDHDALNSAVSTIRTLVQDAALGEHTRTRAFVDIGAVLADRNRKAFTVDDVWEAITGDITQSGVSLTCGTLSKLETVARVYVRGGHALAYEIADVRGGYGTCYQAYLELVKPGTCDAAEAWRRIVSGEYVRQSRVKADGPGEWRMLRVTADTGARFDEYVAATGAEDSDTGVTALLSDNVDPRIAAAITSYLAVGTLDALVATINAATVKARVKRAA